MISWSCSKAAHHGKGTCETKPLTSWLGSKRGGEIRVTILFEGVPPVT